MKQGNNYISHLENFDSTPKAVYAAIAVSFANRFGIQPEEAEQSINEEWTALYQAGIVPQKPPKTE